MVFSMPIPPKPPWYSTPTAIVPLPTAAPNCNSPIESPTDTPSTENCKNKPTDLNIENNNNDRPDDDDDDDNCFPCQATKPVLQQEKQPWYSFSLPAIKHNPTQAPRKRTPKRTRTKQSAYRENNNNRPNDVDCFPRQDKQPVPPQDISTDTLPSLIESPTDKHTETNTDNNNNKRRATPARTKRSAHREIKTKPTHTVVPTAPLLVWDGTQYQLDYNHDHRPISTWDGTTHTDIVYDGDEDYNGTNDYAYGDPFNMNDSSNQLQLTQCLKTVQFRKQLQATNHATNQTTSQATPQATPQTTPHKNQSKQTTMKHTKEDPTPYMYDTLQLMFLTTYYDNTKNYVDEFPSYTVPHYITRKKQHPSHDNYLYRRWNNPTARSNKTKKTRTKHRCPLVTTKDDTSVTPTLETLCTQDTRSSSQTKADILLSITIWNQPIVQYRMPIRPFITSTRNRSRHPSTAVQHALIGVYDKLLHPPNVSCLLPTFTRIVCVVLSCSILLADSFTLVKIDDRYPDEWND